MEPCHVFGTLRTILSHSKLYYTSSTSIQHNKPHNNYKPKQKQNKRNMWRITYIYIYGQGSVSGSDPSPFRFFRSCVNKGFEPGVSLSALRPKSRSSGVGLLASCVCTALLALHVVVDFITQAFNWPKGRPCAGNAGFPIDRRFIVHDLCAPHMASKSFDFLYHTMRPPSTRTLTWAASRGPSSRRHGRHTSSGGAGGHATITHRKRKHYIQKNTLHIAHGIQALGPQLGPIGIHCMLLCIVWWNVHICQFYRAL